MCLTFLLNVYTLFFLTVFAFILYAAEYLDMSEENFSLFNMQVLRPGHEVIVISSQEEFQAQQGKSVAGKIASSKKLPSVSKKMPISKVVQALQLTDSVESDSTDDFVSTVPKKTRSGKVFDSKRKDHPDVEHTDMPKRKAPGIESANLMSNKAGFEES
jgi:hypothetical protein